MDSLAETSSRGGVEGHAGLPIASVKGCGPSGGYPSGANATAGVESGPRETTTLCVCNFEGRQIQEVHTSWRRIVKKSGLPGRITPHTLRHTRATWLMQAGVSPWEAAGHLGMTVKTLESVYGHHHPAYQERAAEV